jgi:hypothetical protein
VGRLSITLKDNSIRKWNFAQVWSSAKTAGKSFSSFHAVTRGEELTVCGKLYFVNASYAKVVELLKLEAAPSNAPLIFSIKIRRTRR